jgi:hypothetical protein
MNVRADGIVLSSLPRRTLPQMINLAASWEENPRTVRLCLCCRSFVVSLARSLSTASDHEIFRAF